MKRRVICLLCVLMCLGLMGTVSAVAEDLISTTLVMRVSHLTQNPVIKAGEDFSMEVMIDGAAPESFQWFFNDELVEGACSRVYNLVNAQPEDSGLYRAEAYDKDGNIVVSMDVSVRVLDDTVPKAGDVSLPIEYVVATMGLAAVGMVCSLVRRKAA